MKLFTVFVLLLVTGCVQAPHRWDEMTYSSIPAPVDNIQSLGDKWMY